MHTLDANKLGAFGVLLSDALGNATADLSPSAAALLLSLFYRQDLTVTALAKVGGIAQPTAVRVLDGLVRQGFIERKGRAGRATVLRVTREGRKRARALQCARLSAMSSVLIALPAQERAAFVRALDAILAAITTSRSFARKTCRLCDHSICEGSRCPIGTRATEIERTVESDLRGIKSC